MSSSLIFSEPPRLTVCIVVDQFSAHYLQKLKPYLSGAMKEWSDGGVSYANAFYTHSPTGTGPGHALLATGTYGAVHGIINNYWFDEEGKKVLCDQDNAETAGVFKPDGTVYEHGRSARNLRADTLSDQLMLHSYPHARNAVWALSLKSRAAICCAGRLGKALWFDTDGASFTSSKAYFESLPEWVQEFNATHAQHNIESVTWEPFFENNSPAYSFFNMLNYAYQSFGGALVGNTFPLTTPETLDSILLKTPHANQLLLDLALTCITQETTFKETDRLVLYVSLSTLDKVGHDFGPDSIECIDLLYHLDTQLKEFVQKIYELYDEEEVLFILTADHGVEQIPELISDQGFTLSHRYMYPTIIEHLNKRIENEFSLSNIVLAFNEPQFYLNQPALKGATPEVRQAITQLIKDYLLSLPGIRHAWTFDELENKVFAPYDLDSYLQRQLYRGRSGAIIFSVSPYTAMGKHATGTSHFAQYAYDTQVPLILYQKGILPKKRVTDNVSMSQLSVTLATLLNVPRPSAAAGNVLPELPL